MIDIPYEHVLEKLKKAGLSEEEIEERTKQKMQQLSGLISKEGAAHIIANEEGITLVEKTSGSVKVKDVFAGMRNIDVLGKAVAVYDMKEFQRRDGSGTGKVGSFLFADETGSLRVTLWGEQANHLSAMKENDVIKISSSYAKENQGRKELHLNDNSKLTVNPPGETVGDVSFSARVFDRKRVEELKDGMTNVELLGTVVSVDALRFYEIDPKTRKRVQLQRDQWMLDGQVIENPEVNYVLNVILDDGTGSIRAVSFGSEVEKTLGVSREALVQIKDTPDIVNIKNAALGKIMKVKGRVRHNQMFDRLEFTAQDVDNKPDPHEEMETLDKQIEEEQSKSGVASVDDL